ncbi:hypothetical protein [Couchioplanes azureus]|uniref:hypothetical protein n=1 Tax=Couchioplanes caeruleus TaxID=56438 RepID=UPI001670232A|nr:hypothetical protein [Couchioplanes caeruleus]GGQ59165.1 putative membrane protein YmcC [Couchioplanes caeruleus subsp. azureus]
MIVAIIACEVGFWVLLAAGLATRYLLRRRRLSTALLWSVPLVDVALLAVAVADLRGGGEAHLAHGLAAVYLGVSVVFGHRMIRWADQRFRHRFAGGPAPARAPRTGAARAARERRDWLQHLLAYAATAVVLGVFTLLVGDVERTLPLWSVMKPWGVAVIVDFVVSFSYTLFPRREAR